MVLLVLEQGCNSSTSTIGHTRTTTNLSFSLKQAKDLQDPTYFWRNPKSQTDCFFRLGLDAIPGKDKGEQNTHRAMPSSWYNVLPFLLCFVCCQLRLVYGLATPSTFCTVVYGPESSELALLTAKLAARESIETFCICSNGSENTCRKLMYGIEYAETGIDVPGKAKTVSDPEAMSSALEKATALTLIGESKPVDKEAVTTLMRNSGPNLSKIVLISKIGVTNAKSGFLGGNTMVKMLESERYIRSIAESKNIQFSIVRVGNLKGGGPGDSGNDFGLSKSYYNAIFDLVEAQVTMSHDRFTLGVECIQGDPLKLPNAFVALQTKSSFDPCPTDTNRINAAAGCVAALFAKEPLEFSVGTAKGEKPPSMDEWSNILCNL